MLLTVVVLRMDNVMGGGVLVSGLWGVRLVLVLLLWFGVLHGGFGGERVFLFSIFGYEIHWHIYIVGIMRVVLNIALFIFIIHRACGRSNLSRSRIKTHKHFIQPPTNRRPNP